MAKPGQTLTWDPEGHLGTLTESGKTTSYIYDTAGNRLAAKDATGETVYLGHTEIRRTTATGAVTATRFYSYAGRQIATRTSPTALSWQAVDLRGTPELSIDAATAALTRLRTDPFGNPRNATAWPSSKGFTGGTTDPTGLTHLGAREYDPGIGRFISSDPIIDVTNPQQANGYTYANSNPATFSDPTGLKACLDECGLADQKAQARDAFAKDMARANFLHNLAVLITYMLIMEKYQRYDPKRHKWITPHITINPAPNRIPGASQKGNGNAGYADIICWDCQKGKVLVWEVKPDTAYGSKDGAKDLKRYITALNVQLAGTGKTAVAGDSFQTVTKPVPGSTSTITVRSGQGADQGVQYYRVDDPEQSSQPSATPTPAVTATPAATPTPGTPPFGAGPQASPTPTGGAPSGEDQYYEPEPINATDGGHLVQVVMFLGVALFVLIALPLILVAAIGKEALDPA